MPTYTDFNISLDRNEKIKATAIASIEDVVGRFQEAVRVATRLAD